MLPCRLQVEAPARRPHPVGPTDPGSRDIDTALGAFQVRHLAHPNRALPAPRLHPVASGVAPEATPRPAARRFCLYNANSGPRPTPLRAELVDRYDYGNASRDTMRSRFSNTLVK